MSPSTNASAGPELAVKSVTLEEAGAHLAELLQWVEQGDEVVIVKDHQPKAKLVAVKGKSARVFGRHRGKARMSPDFDDPLPDDFWLADNP